MATPYTNSNTGGTLPLPRVHIPTWFGIMSPSENNDALLDLDLLFNLTSSSYESSSSQITLNFNNNVQNISEDFTLYQNVITIGDTPPKEGSIIFYSNDNGDVLDENTESAHILYFKHAELHNFKFALLNNHTINRIEKIYMYENEDIVVETYQEEEEVDEENPEDPNEGTDEGEGEESTNNGISFTRITLGRLTVEDNIEEISDGFYKLKLIEGSYI